MDLKELADTSSTSKDRVESKAAAVGDDSNPAISPSAGVKVGGKSGDDEASDPDRMEEDTVSALLG